MKAVLEFNLPEDLDQLKLHLKVTDMLSVLASISNDLRSWEKHGHNFASADEAVSQIRKRLVNYLIESEIDPI